MRTKVQQLDREQAVVKWAQLGSGGSVAVGNILNLPGRLNRNVERPAAIRLRQENLRPIQWEDWAYLVLAICGLAATAIAFVYPWF
jgi:hypothetical protein